MNTLSLLTIGLLAGWLANHFFKSQEIGLTGNLALGIWGSAVGVFLFDLLGLSAYGLIGSAVMAVVASVAVLGLISLMKIA